MTASNKLRARPSGSTAAPPSKPTKRRTEVVVVGAGDETLIEVGPALGDEYRTFSVDTAAEIADLALTSWIGLYDATTEASGRSAFAQLETQYGRQPWIVLCSDEDRPNWRDVLSRGGACAVITRSELSSGALTTALHRAIQRLADGSHDGGGTRSFNPRSPVVWAAGAALAAIVVGGAWWLSRSHTSAPVAAPVTSHKLIITGGKGAHAPAAATPSAPAAPVLSVEDLLSQARIAFRDPNAQLPKAEAPLQGTSALELYGAVLLQQPKNDEALDGVRRLQDVARLRVQNELASGDADTAARLLAILQRASFNPQELRTLEAAVAAARLKQLAAQARSALAAGNLAAARQSIDQLAALNGERTPVPELRKELDARKVDAELTAAAEQVRTAIAAGSLLDPEADNARSRLLSMRELNRSSPQTLAAQHDLLTALLRRVQTEIGHQDLDRAQQTLVAAQEFGSKAELADARNALESAVAAKRAADAASVVAAAARANAQAAAAAPVATFLSPKPTRPMQVDYPPSAQDENIKGYVIVEFMLSPNGSASGATVVESSPRGMFDRSALAAVKRTSFSTVDLADPKKPQRARLKVNYSLDDTPARAPAQAPVKTAAAAPVAAPSATTPANAAVAPPQILSPKATRPLEVNYPQVALDLHRTGYVVVEFLLNPDGTPSSPAVIESTPPKMFDYEALQAVKRAKFVTTGLADPSKAQRARVKINFKGE